VITAIAARYRTRPSPGQTVSEIIEDRQAIFVALGDRGLEGELVALGQLEVVRLNLWDLAEGP
jgi:hypothetical protein